MRLLAIALTAVLIVASVPAIVGGFAMLARRLLGLRFGVVRLLLAGLVGFAVAGPIARPLAGTVPASGGTATPLWFLILAGDLFRIVSAYGLSVPPEVAAVFRALATLEGTLALLSPGFDLVTEARAFAARDGAGQLDPASARQLAADELATLLPILRRLPAGPSGSPARPSTAASASTCACSPTSETAAT